MYLLVRNRTHWCAIVRMNGSQCANSMGAGVCDLQLSPQSGCVGNLSSCGDIGRVRGDYDAPESIRADRVNLLLQRTFP